jgi:hypothetical protein
MNTSRILKNGALALLVATALGFTIAGAQTISSPGPYYAHPAWDQKLPASTRFIVLSHWNNEAVLDRETGLVWERSPSAGTTTASAAAFTCANTTTGGRMGWRLPSLPELTSLVDPSISAGTVELPSGHPFTGISGIPFWTATRYGETDDARWTVQFIPSDPSGPAGALDPSLPFVRHWCVRGPMTADRY